VRARLESARLVRGFENEHPERRGGQADTQRRHALACVDQGLPRARAVGRSATLTAAGASCRRPMAQAVSIKGGLMSNIEEDIVLAHFIVSDDVERSRRFYSEVLGGKVVFSGDVTYVALSNSWIIINVGGGPTDDKPTVTLETPPDPDRVSSFLNIRVKDIAAVYAEWSARGANFLTPPKQHQYEIRCYIRDPDGHLIEVGQTTDPDGDWSPARWPSGIPAEEFE
jgi:catechol 2,3-dioxygenase-like lactoylglutathione lyase family enzyme